MAIPGNVDAATIHDDFLDVSRETIADRGPPSSVAVD
jgi:hypothetical protein